MLLQSWLSHDYIDRHGQHAFERHDQTSALIVLSFTSISVLVLAATAEVNAAPPVKAYSCKDNENICQNICYYTTCAYPDDGRNVNPSLLTRQKQSLHSADTAQRRVDCGATHSPPPFQSKADGGLAIPNLGPSPDEYPFASTSEGGLTRYQDGAGLLGVPVAEQRKQGGKVNGFWTRDPEIADGEQAYIMLQDTAGIPYCDTSVTTANPFCDGSKFVGVHFNKGSDQYCQWAIETTNAKCYDGQTGDEVATAAKLRRRDPEVNESGVPVAYYGMLHVRYPDMAAAMWNEDIHGPMPDDYEPITSIEQWLAMNRTAGVMPPAMLPRNQTELFGRPFSA